MSWLKYAGIENPNQKLVGAEIRKCRRFFDEKIFYNYKTLLGN